VHFLVSHNSNSIACSPLIFGLCIAGSLFPLFWLESCQTEKDLGENLKNNQLATAKVAVTVKQNI